MDSLYHRRCFAGASGSGDHRDLGQPGRSAGLALAFGVLSGSYTWAMLTASGLSALIRTYGQAIIVLKIAGACYLFWLAYNALRAAMQGDAQPSALRVPRLPP